MQIKLRTPQPLLIYLSILHLGLIKTNTNMQELEQRIEDLENRLRAMNDYSKLTLEFERALIARGFMSASDKSSIARGLNLLGGVTETIYTAPSSGAPATTATIVIDGLITN